MKPIPVLAALALLVPLLAGAPAQAQAPYPQQRVTLVTHSSPGGGTDVFLRELSKHLAPIMKTNFAVENVRGGSGATAVAQVAASKPDGSMFYGTTPTYIQTTLLSKPQVGYDGLDPIAIVFIDPEVIYTRTESPFKTLADFIAATRRDPGKLNIGTINVGGTQNLGAELLRMTAKLDVQIVPYRNSPDIVVAVLRNDMQMLVEFPPAVKGQVADGKMRLLATSGPKRFPAMPDVPTVGEAGVAGYEVTSWNGVFAPKGTRPEVIAILNKALTEVLALPDIQARFLDLGVVAKPSTPDELMALLKADVAKWADVIEKAGIEKK